MTAGPDHLVSTREQLRDLYREPTQFVIDKERPIIDAATRAFIERCPFVMLATRGADGSADVSPRGGPSGFVRVLDDTHVAIADLPGNNRLDTLENIIETGAVGLLFMIPGYGETVRLNGRAVLSTDPEVLAGFTDELKRPKAAIVVEVVTTFIHCAKALQRGKLWEPDAWSAFADAPDGADIVACQNSGLVRADEVRTALAESYVVSLAEERADAQV